MQNQEERSRDQYRWFTDITSRWSDNDIYGHVNNVVYYSYFDTIANTFLIQNGGLDIHNGETIGFVVKSQCNYYSPIAFPDKLTGGLKVNKLGNSSVEYGIAVFTAEESEAAAAGTFTHVFVDRDDQRPTPIDEFLRCALEELLAER